MPYYEATAFSQYSPDAKSELFPHILPALWDALSIQPHADLSENNIMIQKDQQRFILIDPGVYISSAGYGKCLFTTNAANYPVFFPHEHKYSYRCFPGKTLSEIADLSGSEYWQPDADIPKWNHTLRNPAKRPTAADLQALGLMYYRILTAGTELSRIFGDFKEPAWTGSFGPLSNQYEVHYDKIHKCAMNTIDSALAELEPATREVVRALVLLETKTRGDLEIALQPVLDLHR